jgi:UDP-N-acetylmuramoyl-L-alanyl-D-glutamate--2,6-diaminopimelate ligase
MLSTQARGGVSLRDLLPEARFVRAVDVRATSCCTRADRCQSGDVFVAIAAADYDGHDHAAEAVERGASAVLAERLLPVGTPLIVVDDSREALGEICQALVDRPSDMLRTIGVTGTHGKTTASWLLASVLQAADRQVGLLTSVAYSDSHEARRHGQRRRQLRNWPAGWRG